MALRDQLMPDWRSAFVNLNEFGELRSFRISDGAGGFTELKFLPVLIDEEATKEKGIVTAQEVYLGDMYVNVAADLFPRRPISGELIYMSEQIPTGPGGIPLEDRPANVPYDLLEVVDEIGVWRFALTAYRT
jgi:hypothetical protein